MTTGPRMLRTSVLAIAFLVALALCSVAQAADNTYTVNTTADSQIATPGSTTCADALGTCSIRAAIDAANNNSGNDTIVVPAGRYDRTLGDTGEDNSLGDFNVANNGTLTIQGQTGDPKDVIISADGLDRVIEIDAGGTLTATGVTFQDGFTGGNGAGILVNGGTVVQPPGPATPTDVTTLTLNNSRVLKNVTIDSSGGGIWGTRSATSVITLNSSNVDNNNARENGGGIGYEGPGSILKMFDSTVDGNQASVFDGGGIWDDADPNNPTPLSPTHAAITTANETLHIERSSVSDNQAPGGDGEGGGIYSRFCDCGTDVGDVNITDSHIDHNFAASAGAGVFNNAGEVNASGTTFNNNTSHDGSGGGIFSEGDGVSLTNTHVDGNFAYWGGGGVCNASGPLTVDGSTVNNNQARQQDGGGLSNAESCFFFLLGAHKQVQEDALTVVNSHVAGNFAGNFGGGVNNEQGDATIDSSTVNENVARRDKGGGVYNDGGDLEIVDSHVDQNKADLAQGGGVANDDGSLVIVRTSVDSNLAGSDGTCCGRGGGVYSNGTQKPPIIVSGTRQSDLPPGTHIIDTSISKNHAFSSGGGLWDNTGADIVNTTIANNVADTEQTENDHQGGGIFDHGEGMTLTNVTLAGNIVNDGEGGGIWANNVDPTFTNTIIADNQANFDPSTSDCGGSSYTSGGHNLDGFQSTGGPDQCGLTDGTNGDQTGKHANLGPLQDNGGPTLTRALLDGSPAIDGGDDSVCANLTTDDNTDPHDQRQAHRPAGAACDVGAYEANSLADLAITKSGPARVNTGGSISYTLHVTNNGPDKILAVHVHDALPGGTTFVSASPSQGTCNGGVDCDLGAIASGGSATITVVVTAPGGATTLTNTATVSGAPTEVDGSNNSASVQTQVVAPGTAPLIQGPGPGPSVQPNVKACTKTPPRTSISRNGLEAAADTLRFVGRSIDLRCLTSSSLGIKKVQIAIALKSRHGKCRFLTKSGDLTDARSCSRRVYLAARRGRVRNGKVPWTFRVRHLNLPNGSYFVIARGTDTNNDVETKIRTYNKKSFTIG